MLHYIVLCVLFVVNVKCDPDHPKKCTRRELTCTSDCSGIIHCDEPGDMAWTSYCSSRTPHCFEGQCVEHYRPCNQSKKTPFQCSQGDGTYPDPETCTLYYTCLDGKAFKTSCAKEGLIFSPRIRTCVVEDEGHRCGNKICEEIGDGWGTSEFDLVAFFCSEKKVLDIVRCEGNNAFNKDTGKCEFRCPEQGRFPYELDDAKFYECWKNTSNEGISFEYAIRKCPEACLSFFNQTTSLCQPLEKCNEEDTTMTTTSVPTYYNLLR